MSVNRTKKEKLVQEISDNYDNYSSFYLLNFDKMSVEKSNHLRQKLRENSYAIKVIKNRLALKAFNAELPEELKESFIGPTALAYAKEDPVGLAKILKEFSIQNKVLSVKAAILEGRYFPGEKFEEISQLSSREEMIAKIGYMMASPLIKLLGTLQSPISGFGRLLHQLKEQK